MTRPGAKAWRPRPPLPPAAGRAAGGPAGCTAGRAVLLAVVPLALGLLALAPAPARAFTAPWAVSGPWPGTSHEPVRALDHPTVEARLGAANLDASAGFRFAVWGDQRALADGEWQELVAALASEAARDERLLFLVDTGDIVDDGVHTDQFAMLRSLLAPVARLPYLVAVGNHELHDNEVAAARANTAIFLGYLDPAFSAQRMYYRKDIGPASFYFLDTNDLIYGESGTGSGDCPPGPGSRGEMQLAWLARELPPLAAPDGRLRIVVMHHPLLHASERHGGHARALWNCTAAGRRLADLLADGGVSLILTGHTHTYERYRLRRDDGREIALVNLSGRPRTSFLWFGASARRPRAIAGGEREWFAAEGFTGLERWDLRQEEAMSPEREANQFAIFTVEPGGGLRCELHFLDAAAAGGVRREPALRLR